MSAITSTSAPTVTSGGSDRTTLDPFYVRMGEKTDYLSEDAKRMFEELGCAIAGEDKLVVSFRGFGIKDTSPLWREVERIKQKDKWSEVQEVLEKASNSRYGPLPTAADCEEYAKLNRHLYNLGKPLHKTMKFWAKVMTEVERVLEETKPDGTVDKSINEIEGEPSVGNNQIETPDNNIPHNTSDDGETLPATDEKTEKTRAQDRLTVRDHISHHNTLVDNILPHLEREEQGIFLRSAIKSLKERLVIVPGEQATSASALSISPDTAPGTPAGGSDDDWEHIPTSDIPPDVGSEEQA